MKLKGSKTEERFREELLASRKSLLRDPNMARLRRALKNAFSEMKTAYVLGWTPEQGEDLYRVLVNTDLVVAIELNRANPAAEPSIASTPANLYGKNLSRQARLRLAVAIELATADARAGSSRRIE